MINREPNGEVDDRPLPYEPPVIETELTQKPRQVWWRAHLVALMFLLPFSAMLVAHRYLGLSDALMAAPPPGQASAFTYNMWMIGSFYFGVAGYILHVTLVADRTPGWIIAKLVLLVVSWSALIALMS